MELRKVFICSPLKPVAEDEEERAEEVQHNLNVAKFASIYALLEHAMPMAPHLYFPNMLDDDDLEQRECGMALGIEWLKGCDELWIIGRRVSEGMATEIAIAKELGIPIRHYVMPREPHERLKDAIDYPNIDFREMTV